jgi:hypothetical protein
LGLRPVRGRRADTEKVPNPEILTRSPCRSAAVMSSRMMLIAFSASDLCIPSLLANPSIISVFVIRSILLASVAAK